MSRPARLPVSAGERFGRWTIVGSAGVDATRHALVRVRCDCGFERVVSALSLRNGNSKSCGCLRDDVLRARGAVRSRVRGYAAWASMIRRCHDATDDKFHLYGERGIHVCDAWRGDAGFATWKRDMGPRPSLKHSVDRIDNDKGYEPGNCRWATQSEQMNNTRVNRRLTVDGKTMTLAQWGRETGLAPTVIHCRISRGWTIDDAVKAPRVPRGHRLDRKAL